MTKDFYALIQNIKTIAIEKRCDFLIQTYNIEKNPEYYLAIHLIKYFTWKKSDRKKLMLYFFQKMPFASAIPYENFLKIMPEAEFYYYLTLLLSKTTFERQDLNLIRYHLTRTIRSEKTLQNLDELLNKK